jgi:hypothetical protein
VLRSRDASHTSQSLWRQRLGVRVG